MKSKLLFRHELLESASLPAESSGLRSDAPPSPVNRSVIDSLAVHDGGFAFDSNTGETYSLSESAILIIQAIREGLARNDLLCRLQAHYDIDRHTAARDLDSFVESLAAFGLLTSPSNALSS